MKISPSRLGKQPPPLGRPLLAHKYAANSVGQPTVQAPRQQQRAVPTRVVPQVPVIQQQSPSVTTRPVVEEEQHQTIDINLNINVNTGGSQEFKINMNGKQQQQPITKPLSPTKIPMRAVRPSPQPVNFQRALPQHQVLPRGLPHRVPSPSRGLRIPSPQRGGRTVALPNATLLPPQSTFIPAPQIVYPQVVRVSNITRSSQLPTSHEMQIQTDSFDEFEVKSEFWRLDDNIHDQPEIIMCVICHESYDVRNTSEHVGRHRRKELSFPQVPHARVGYESMREPQFRPIVEPEEFVMKPQRNVYVVEKIPRGGRSSFQSNGLLLGSGDIPIVPTLDVTPASLIRPPVQVTEVTEVVEVIDNIPPSNIAPSSGGVMIGGTPGHNRLMNQLAYGEQAATTTTTTVVQDQNGRVTQVRQVIEEHSPNQSIRLNPHTTVIDPLPQPVVVEEHIVHQPMIPITPANTILDNSGMMMQPTYMDTSVRSHTLVEQQQFIPQPQYIPQPIPASLVQPEHQSTQIIIQQGNGVGGSRIIINQESPPEHVNLFNQPQFAQQAGMRFVESGIGGNAMFNSVGQYPTGPMMTSNLPGGQFLPNTVQLPPVMEAAAIDANHFGVNASQSSIHQIDHSIASHPHDGIIPNNYPQEVTLVTQQNISQHPLDQQPIVMESRLSNRSMGQAIIVPATTIQTTTQGIVEQPMTVNSRLREIDSNSSFQHPSIIIPPGNQPAPIMNSAYNPNLPPNTPMMDMHSAGPLTPMDASGMVSRLQPQGVYSQQQFTNQQSNQPLNYNYDRGSTGMQQSTRAQLTEAQRRAFQQSQQPQRSRVPMNMLAGWS